MRTMVIGLSILVIIFAFRFANAQEENAIQGTEIAVLDVPNAIQVAWNFDLSKLAILTGEQILVWNTDDWQLIYTIPDAYVYAIAWHPNENIIAGVRGGRQEALVIWDGETGQQQNQIIRRLPDNITGIVVLHTLSWSPDGSQVASDSVIDTIVTWDLALGTYETLVPLFEDVQHNIIELLWSDSGTYLLSGAVDGKIRVWDAQTGTEILQVEGYEYVAWSPDESLFAGAGFETEVNIWGIQSGEIQVSFSEHTHTITSVDWNTQYDVLSSTDVDGILFIWESATGNVIPFVTPSSEYVRGAVWRPDGMQLAIIAGDFVRVVNW